MLQVTETIDAPLLTSLRLESARSQPYRDLPIVSWKLQSLELGGASMSPDNEALGFCSATLAELSLWNNTDLQEMQHFQCLTALLQIVHFVQDRSRYSHHCEGRPCLSHSPHKVGLFPGWTWPSCLELQCPVEFNEFL